MPSNSGKSYATSWLENLAKFLGLRVPDSPARRHNRFQVMTLEDRRLLAGDVLSVDVTTPSSDLVTDETSQITIEVTFDQAMTPDNFSGDPAAMGPKLIFSNSGGPLPGLATGVGASLTNPVTTWSMANTVAEITFDVVDQNVQIADIEIDVVDVLDAASMPQNDYDPIEVEFSIDTLSTAVRIDNSSVVAQSESSTTYMFTVTRTGTTGALDVSYTVAGFGPSAADAADFDMGAFPSGMASFSDGQDTTQITFDITNDAIVELDEQFQVTLVDSAAIVLTQATATGQINNDDAATFSIDDVTLNEGDSTPTTFSFTVTLNAAVDTGVSVNFATADDSALDGQDYTANSGTLMFAGSAGETMQINVNVSGDQVVELDEQFFVNLSGVSASGRAVTIADSQGVGAVTNDDAATFSIADVTLNEGDSGTTSFSFTVTLNAAVDTAVSVDFATADDSALDGQDYTAANGTLAFAGNAGETMQVNVNVSGDEVVELDEQFFVNLSNVSATGRDVTIADSQGVGAVTNDDAATFSIDDVTMVEGDMGNTMFTFTITLSAAVDTALMVDYATADNTATAGQDYQSESRTAMFAGTIGETEQLTIRVSGDTILELDEQFFVNLSNVSASGRNVTIADSQGLGVITNDDAASLAIDDLVMNEGASGTTTYTFTVTLTGDVDTAVSINYATADDTATAGQDYSSNSGALMFAGNDGETMQISIDVSGDQTVELDEQFFVNLSGVSASGRNVTIADSQGVGAITNDDAATIAIGDVTLNEGDSGATVYSFTVTLSAAVDTGVAVDFATTDDSALDGQDYTATNGTLMFAGNAGETMQVNVNVTGDQVVELDEQFFVNISGLNAGGRSVTISDSQGVGAITNDDSATITIDDVMLNEGDAGTTNFAFTVTLSDAVDTTLSLNFSSADDTATAGQDYTAVGGTLMFAGNAGETMLINVTVSGDQTLESDEQFFVNLSALLAGGRDVTIADAQGVGSITNDDSASFTINDVILAEADAGTVTYSFTVTLSADVDTSVSIDYATADDTATAGQDYTAAANTLVFAGNAGETMQIDVTVAGDQVVELNEQFFVNLSGVNANGRNVTIADGQGVGAINNNDSATIAIGDVTLAEGDAGTTTFSFTVTLSADVDTAVSVDFATADVTATAGADYTGVSSTLTFPANTGGTMQIDIDVTGEQLVELDESFVVNLSSLNAGGRAVTILDSQGLGAITNDDTATISIDDVTLTEGDAGTTNFIFNVTLSADVDTAVSIDFSSLDDTAVAGVDYSAVGGTLTFPAAASAAMQINVAVTGDQIVELDERFLVNLTTLNAGGRNVTVADSQGEGSITNDDTATISIDDITLAEGSTLGTTNFTFTVTLSHAVDVGVAVDFDVADGTTAPIAVAADDYVDAAGTLNFLGNAGETMGITVSVVADQDVELDETFLANLSNIVAGGRNVIFADSRAWRRS